MNISVLKRNGEKEEFMPEKIIVSLVKTGATPEVARKIAKIIEGRLLERGVSEIATKDLMKEVLELLKKENEEWYNNWLVFDRAVKKRKIEA
ncbi:ATPase [Fervidicoccus fontis]|uniref:ATP-cone domain protein n=2 Tax=Fervidicoccus fontis TaxID=683846 RepID=I0A0R0_FERFK|nr:ATP cone domain-containing protein [Fervidicoccus fontis]AFH42567.1 ATP-cone domain protein [Fervidicoccus fontis Kam940]MBE9391175.1 ATPase [Fervidicoccus fontis]PMB75675.1 MAG: transcriptional repressor NrdR [Fervidicoccus fontis]PMB78167.1 MAG: transcriptional repressor NrdR [Fervidicoccus fontis]HEW64025.1 ATPase [Fervidicoccus fontis]